MLWVLATKSSLPCMQGCLQAGCSAFDWQALHRCCSWPHVCWQGCVLAKLSGNSFTTQVADLFYVSKVFRAAAVVDGTWNQRWVEAFLTDCSACTKCSSCGACCKILISSTHSMHLIITSPPLIIVYNVFGRTVLPYTIH